MALCRNRRIRWIVVVLSLMLMRVVGAADLSSYRVLLINSYHPTFHTMPKISQGLKDGFGDQPPTINIEYMDSKRLYDDTSRRLFYESLAYKLKHRPPYNLIITADDNALNFVQHYRTTLFPDIPVVFLGLNDYPLATQLATQTNRAITGVVEAVSVKENLALMATLRPKMHTLYLITDGTPTGQSDLKRTRSFQSQFSSFSIHVINLATLSWAEFIHALQQIEPDDGILLLSAFRDKLNVNRTFDDSLKDIIHYARAPVFHLYDQGIGQGLVGGILVSHTEHGRQAAAMASHILQGTPVSAVPVMLNSPNLPIFDSRALSRFHIPLASLPPDSELRYQPQTQSVLTLHWREITVVVIILTLLTSLVIVLAHQNRIRHRHNQVLEENDLRLRTVLNNVDAYIYMKDAQGRYLFVNTPLCQALGLDLDDVIGNTASELFDPTIANKIMKVDNAVFRHRTIYKQEETYWSANDRNERHIQTTKIPLINQEQHLYGLCGISLDITEHKNHEKELQHIAHHDQLTGLPNRVLFADRLEQAMKYADRNQGRITVMYFDLDGFKHINDQYGHDHGDYLLQVTARRVKNVIRKNDTVARLGGDEFIILLLNSYHPKHDLQIVHKLLACVAEPMTYHGHELAVTASFGITSYPQLSDIQADKLIRQADQAMYVAKNSGRNRFHFFDAQLEDNALQLEKLINDITLGLKRHEFCLYYQPKVNLLTGQVIGMEALIRWQHPDRGLLPPGTFLPEVEQHNIMIDIDKWVVQASLRQLDEWRRQNIHLPVSINVSHLYFKQDDLERQLKLELSHYPQLDPTLLELEIIETRALDNLTDVANKISDCQRLGVHFSLDDFGTGYSSLTYLKKLPVNILKVDNSFVIDMLEDHEDRRILEGILALGNAFNLNVIAEGMESNRHQHELKRMGYRYAQGYGIAKPMPADEVALWLERWEKPEEWC